jgi:hypothetical protein
VGDKVEVIWTGDEKFANVHVCYTDTPAPGFYDFATNRIIASSDAMFSRGTLGRNNKIASFTVAAPGPIPPAPPMRTVIVEASSIQRDWFPSHGAIAVKINGGEPKQITIIAGVVQETIKVPFTAKVGDRVEILWLRGFNSHLGQMFAYYSDRPARNISDSANIIGAAPSGGPSNATMFYTTLADFTVR